MEKIYRTINLEKTKNRTVNALPYYAPDNETDTCVYHDDENTWGGYCVDIIIPTSCKHSQLSYLNWISDLIDIYHFPEIEIQEDEGVLPGYLLRYKNLMMLYFWVMNYFIPSITFYQKCTDSFKYIKVTNKKDVFKTITNIYPSLPNDDDTIEIGSIIGVTEIYNEFIEKFVTFDTCKNFLDFIERIQTKGLIKPLYESVPYLDVDFSITSNQFDIGILTPVIENWIPKKRYFIGEKVMYNGKCWKLTQCEINIDNCELCEISGDILTQALESIDEHGNNSHYRLIDDINQLPAQAFNYVNNLQYILKKSVYNGYIYYFIYPFDSGYYNPETKITEFDTYHNHWQEISLTHESITDTPSGVRKGYTFDNEELTGITESKLIALKRKVLSVDDYGEILPFVITDDNPSNTSGEIQYSLGIVNEIESDDGTWRCDTLVSIEKNVNNVETGWVNISSISPTSDDFSENGYVKFTYIIGCQLDVQIDSLGIITKTIVPYTGVKYEEVWKYMKLQLTTSINRSEYTFDYISFYPVEDNIDINGKNTILSKITYYGKELLNLNTLLCDNIKEDDLLGVQNINTYEYDLHTGRYVSSINTYIERGKSGAFERHQILGEIKTFADLENYRNNFFQL